MTTHAHPATTHDLPIEVSPIIVARPPIHVPEPTLWQNFFPTPALRFCIADLVTAGLKNHFRTDIAIITDSDNAVTVAAKIFPYPAVISDMNFGTAKKKGPTTFVPSPISKPANLSSDLLAPNAPVEAKND